MGDTDLAGVLVTLIAVLTAGLGVASLLRLSARRGIGLFQYFPYAVLLSLGVFIFFSGRELSLDLESQNRLLAQTSPASSWTTRLTSLFLVSVSIATIVSYALGRDRSGSTTRALLLAYVVYWLTSVLSPALLAPYGSYLHDYLYTLLMGCAALLLSQRESDATLAAARNALLAFMAISIALIQLRPTLVLDFNYAGGLIPGLPRFAGLTPQPVALGMLAQLGLLCLYAQPMSHRWLNRLCWALGLFTLFLAQSKTSWLSFPVCIGCMSWIRGDLGDGRRFGRLRRRFSSLAIPLVLVVVTVGLGLVYLVERREVSSESFFGQHGANFASLSGRDRIWAVALDEWQRHPLFGYGTTLFDETYRAAIGMPYATSGHNMLLSALARGGLVNAAGLGLYAMVLLVLAVRYARASRGLSIAIYLAITFQSVGEVPLQVFRYGPDVLEHFLLLAVLAGHIEASRARGSAMGSVGKRGGPMRRDIVLGGEPGPSVPTYVTAVRGRCADPDHH